MYNIGEINLYANEFILYLDDKTIDLMKFSNEIKNFLNKIESSESFDDIKNFLFASPIHINDKTNMLKNFTNNEDLLKLCKILVEKSKSQSLFPILYKIITINNDRNNIKDVKVFSVIKMSDDQLKKIRTLIKKHFSCDGNIENILDKSIIGGFVIEVESYLLDFSIRNQLNSIERKIFA